ncbi:hypothetical protein SAMN04488109_0692 [Chryseolinea serpens]|uniref:Uncharacterized protein n=1 Tax=Chryseolinea serpens TaxID=947013 RepID=A0A1M5KKE1_9BACT|nr:hypothetical protein [Chryseolinea serpens]SHG53140.1 hypothetical protein SAMN04488109_0692 [Chryseolinea serpens]
MNIEKEQKSDAFRYYSLKYFFMVLFVLGAGGFTKDALNKGHYTLEDFVRDGTVLAVLLWLHHIYSPSVCQAEITKEGIWLTTKKYIKWEDVDFVNRLGNIFGIKGSTYVIKIKSKWRYYLFPASLSWPDALFNPVEHSHFDQLIRLMKKKHGI